MLPSTLSRTAPTGVVFATLAISGFAACGPNRVANSVASERRDNPPSQATYILRDNGVRCFRAPCFHIDVIPLSGGGQTKLVSDVDFSALDPSPNQESLLSAALETAGGLKVEGEIDTGRGDIGGKVFRVTRVLESGDERDPA